MNKRILILEDDKESLDIFEEILIEEGYHIIALDHFESVDNIIDFAPQLILLDIRLSGGYGHLLCKELKANPTTCNIPVILVSGADNLKNIAKEYHADDYLPKPFDLKDLVEMVKKYLTNNNISLPL